MSKSHCITIGCKNAPIDGARCAVHGGEVVGLKNSENREGEMKRTEDEPFTAEGGKPEAAVNGEQSTEKPKRCKALNAKGEPCRSTSVDESGLCAAHGHRAPIGTAEDARKAALAGGKVRRERVEARQRRLEDAKLSLGDLLRIRALERKEELVASLIDAAVQGRDVPALRVVFDRLEGRVAERVEMTDGLTQEELDMVKRSREYAKLAELSDEDLRARIGVDS